MRVQNAGRKVQRLEYQAFASMAEKQGARIVTEALRRFAVLDARCVHRVGRLALGDLAVWVGVSAAHRGPAFDACRFIIDEIKARVPIWKKEFYAAGDSGWIDPTAPAPDPSLAAARKTSRPRRSKSAGPKAVPKPHRSARR